MSLPKISRPNAANDNRHNQLVWEVLHTWLDLWFENNKIPRTKTKYNKALHYMYELKNRPWLPKDDCTTEALYWLRRQAIQWNIPVIWPA